MTAVRVFPVAAAVFFASAKREGSRRTVVLMIIKTYEVSINMSIHGRPPIV
jgi:hypothetical protein